MTPPAPFPAGPGPVEEQQEAGEEYGDVYDRVTAVLAKARWRQGRRVGRTIYAQFTDVPLDSDPLIGVMDYPALAEAVVTAHNALSGEPQ